MTTWLHGVKQYPHIAYGLRRDGSIGLESGSNPVLESIGYDEDSFQPREFQWSDGSTTKRWRHAPGLRLRNARLVSA